MSISENCIIYPGVKLGKNVIIEDYCVIGAPPRGKKPGELETIIGDNAVIRSHTVIYAGNNIGENFQTGNKVNIRELNNIGDNVSIGTLSVIEHHVGIKSKARIHTQVFIPEYSEIEEGAWIGPNVVFTNAKFPNTPDAKNDLVGPKIKKGAVVGANSTLLPGVIIDENSLIGAGSVVTRSTEKNSVYVGNPAKKIREK